MVLMVKRRIAVTKSNCADNRLDWRARLFYDESGIVYHFFRCLTVMAPANKKSNPKKGKGIADRRASEGPKSNSSVVKTATSKAADEDKDER